MEKKIPLSLSVRSMKGFTLVELLIVVALIAMLSAWTIMSSSDNSQTVALDAKSRISNDIVMFRKLSLVEKNDDGYMKFITDGGGFWLSYPTHNNYLLTLDTTNQNTNSWEFIINTENKSASGTWQDLDIMNINTNMDLLYRDSHNTIRSVKEIVQSIAGGEYGFTLPVPDSDATKSLPLDQYLTLYYQDPEKPQDKSNEVAFMFLSQRNYNDTDADDIITKLYYYDEANPTTKIPLKEALAIFDAYGRIRLEGVKSNDTTLKLQKIYMDFYKRSKTDAPYTTLPLPADY